MIVSDGILILIGGASVVLFAYYIARAMYEESDSIGDGVLGTFIGIFIGALVGILISCGISWLIESLFAPKQAFVTTQHVSHVKNLADDPKGEFTLTLRFIKDHDSDDDDTDKGDMYIQLVEVVDTGYINKPILVRESKIIQKDVEEPLLEWSTDDYIKSNWYRAKQELVGSYYLTIPTSTEIIIVR